MPLADAAFADSEGRPDRAALIELGPSLEVVVSPLVDPPRPPTEGHTTHALIDTGATQSCIDIQVAQSLNLPVVDFVMIADAPGANRGRSSSMTRTSHDREPESVGEQLLMRMTLARSHRSAARPSGANRLARWTPPLPRRPPARGKSNGACARTLATPPGACGCSPSRPRTRANAESPCSGAPFRRRRPPGRSRPSLAPSTLSTRGPWDFTDGVRLDRAVTGR